MRHPSVCGGRQRWTLAKCFGLLVAGFSVVQGQNSTDQSSSLPSPTASAIAISSPSSGFIPQPTGTTPGGFAPNPNYALLLNDSLWFYEAQRAGPLWPNNRVTWRNASTLSDGSDVGLNLAAGYFDAGDYVKFTLPMAYSMTIVAWGAIEWFQGFQLAVQDGYVRDMLKWGMDWLMNAHPKPNVIVAQVGNGTLDNNYWGPDTDIPLPRPTFLITSNNTGTDLAALVASAFAANSILFRSVFNNATYADQLLQHAKDAYAFAESSPQQIYLNSVPKDQQSFYPTSQYGDKLVFGAQWLYRATNDSSYLTKASNYFDSFSVSNDQAPMDWSDQSVATCVLGAKLDSTNTKYAKCANSFMDAVSNNQLSGCTRTGGGLMWCNAASNDNSLIPAMDSALLALIHCETNPPNAQSYRQFAMSQIDYVLGVNPEKTPYVVGVHPNSPQNPHDAKSSGGDDISNIDGSPVVSLHTLYGAIVGGPAKDDYFSDDRADYTQTEVALDYNAPFVGLMAYQVLNSQSDPPYTTIPPGRPTLLPGLSTGAIIGIVVAFVVVLILLVLLFVWCIKRGALRGWWAKNRGKRAEAYGL